MLLLGTMLFDCKLIKQNLGLSRLTCQRLLVMLSVIAEFGLATCVPTSSWGTTIGNRSLKISLTSNTRVDNNSVGGAIEILDM
jgi:hypothetical protein